MLYWTLVYRYVSLDEEMDFLISGIRVNSISSAQFYSVLLDEEGEVSNNQNANQPLFTAMVADDLGQFSVSCSG